jgi:hypothetical protein
MFLLEDQWSLGKRGLNCFQLAEPVFRTPGITQQLLGFIFPAYSFGCLKCFLGERKTILVLGESAGSRLDPSCLQDTPCLEGIYLGCFCLSVFGLGVASGLWPGYVTLEDTTRALLSPCLRLNSLLDLAYAIFAVPMGVS